MLPHCGFALKCHNQETAHSARNFISFPATKTELLKLRSVQRLGYLKRGTEGATDAKVRPARAGKYRDGCSHLAVPRALLRTRTNFRASVSKVWSLCSDT